VNDLTSLTLEDDAAKVGNGEGAQTRPPDGDDDDGRRAAPGWITNAPSSRWLPRVNLAELWDSRELVLVLARRNVKARYKQTLLGAGWAVLQPLIGVVIFTFVMRRLAHVPSDGIPYPVFAFAGLIAWTYFVNGATQAAESLVAYRELVTKVYFPRLLAPLSAILPGLIDLGISLAALGVMMAIFGVHPGRPIVFFPLFLVCLVVTTGGIALVLSAANARYRDVRNALVFLLQIGLFVTPVIYPSSLATGPLHTVLYVNPLAGVIDCFRWSLIDGPRPPSAVVLSFASMLVVCAIGLISFMRVERRLADLI
jgi:homopolymeric O-antigen transport system permease protein